MLSDRDGGRLVGYPASKCAVSLGFGIFDDLGAVAVSRSSCRLMNCAVGVRTARDFVLPIRAVTLKQALLERHHFK